MYRQAHLLRCRLRLDSLHFCICATVERRGVLQGGKGGKVKRLAAGHKAGLLLAGLIADRGNDGTILDAGPVLERRIAGKADVWRRFFGGLHGDSAIVCGRGIVVVAVFSVVGGGPRWKAHVKLGAALCTLDGTSVVRRSRKNIELFRRSFIEMDVARSVVQDEIARSGEGSWKRVGSDTFLVMIALATGDGQIADDAGDGDGGLSFEAWGADASVCACWNEMVTDSVHFR